MIKHIYKPKRKEHEVEEKQKVKKDNKEIYLHAFEVFLIVTIIITTFYFGSWLWAICLGMVFICFQVKKVVDWLLIKKKTHCDICQKNLIEVKKDE